jgi:arginine decarboxylase
MRRYFDVIDQTFYFPTPEFNINGEGELNFHNIPLMDIIREYGTPLKLSYLPKITSNIQQANQWFNEAIARVNYRGNYRYCYCTKASHFQFVMERALQENVHLETSSAYDMMILRKLHQEGLISKNTYIICNGYKRELYLQYITEFLNEGFVNCIPVVDNLDELNYYENQIGRAHV